MMIQITPEGHELKNGFNFYPKNDKNSKGGRLRIEKFIIMFRWSVARQRMFWNPRWAL